MSAIRNAPIPGEQGFPGLERPLTARSVMASLLLGMHPPRLAAQRLVAWCSLFGIAPGTARVALHRMVNRGELVAADGTYELSGALARRQQAQDWSLDPRPTPWSGNWRLAVVGDAPRDASQRRLLRDAMRRLRFVELRDGVWIRPDNLPPDAAIPDAITVADAQCRWFDSTPEGDVDALVRRFDPEAWAARARNLMSDLEDAAEVLDARAGSALASTFELGAAVLGHIRTDPLLPEELIPPRWPGAELRQAYGRYRDAFAAVVADWFSR